MSRSMIRRLVRLEKQRPSRDYEHPHIFMTIDGELVDFFYTPGLVDRLGWGYPADANDEQSGSK